jgi:hypothetical protein
MNVFAVLFELLNLDMHEVIEAILSVITELCDRFEKEVGFRDAIIREFEQNSGVDLLRQLDFCQERAFLLCDRLGLV